MIKLFYDANNDILPDYLKFLKGSLEMEKVLTHYMVRM